MTHYEEMECGFDLGGDAFEECDDCGSMRGIDRGYAIQCDDCVYDGDIADDYMDRMSERRQMGLQS